MRVNMWLDDVRPAPEGWVHVRTVEEAKSLVLANDVEEMSLDHDLGLGPICGPCRTDPFLCDGNPSGCECECHEVLEATGDDFVKWMAETGAWPRVKPLVHSQNPIGSKRMRDRIDDYWPGAR